MNRTYDEIIESMKAAYFEESGFNPEESSDIMRLFEIFASELFSVSCYGDYIYRQSFVQTATGNNLDMLGELRGCKRKGASKARGSLTFGITEPSENDTEIPAMTVCSVSDKPYLQYKTLEKCVIKAGELTADTEAEALGDGDKFNIEGGRINVMVNAPVGVSFVCNSEAFKGGCDEEYDESYRKRILNHYKILPTGYNTASFENQVLLLDYVTDCNIPPAETENDIAVYVTTQSGRLTMAQNAEICSRIYLGEMTGAHVCAEMAMQKDFSVKADVNVMRGFDNDEIRREIEKRLRNSASKARIGRIITLNELSSSLSGIAGVTKCDVYSEEALNGTVYCSGNEKLHLRDVLVRCFNE